MREKNKSRKIGIVLSVSIVVIIISVYMVSMLDNKSSSLISNIDKDDKVINTVDEVESKELEEVVEDKGEESTTEETKTEVSNTPKTINNSSNSKSKSSNNNNSTNTPKTDTEKTTTSSQSQATTNTTTSNNEVKQQPSVDLTQVASPNDINYGIHKGIAEFSTNAGCEKAGNDIVDIELNQVIAYNAENDNTKSVDIRYPACYQVTSQANTIMGYYLNIYCESGNCNRYKSLINISDYD